VNTEGDELLLLSFWLLASLNPSGGLPVLALTGEHGGGKSSAATLLSRLIDPQAAERLAPFKDSDGLFAAGGNRWVIPLDNLGRINAEWSDIFCRLSTGGALSKRKLYSDNDDFSVSLRRPLILNGIGLEPDKPDLLDRAIIVRLASIPPNRRRTESALRETFEAARPRLLGALCSAVSGALRCREYTPPGLPRMADAATWVLRAAKAGALPWDEGQITEALARAEAQKIEAALCDDLVGAAVLKIAEEQNFSGTASDLLRRIAFCTPQGEQSLLPRQPKSLSRRMEELAPFLRAKGVHVRRSRSGGSRLIAIEKIIG
jgi:hypothetical protein